MRSPTKWIWRGVGLSVGDNGALGKYTSSRKVETQQQLFDSSSESCSEINFYQKPSTQTFLGHCHAFFFNLNGERTRDEAVRMSTGDGRRKKGLLTQGQRHSSETKNSLIFHWPLYNFHWPCIRWLIIITMKKKKKNSVFTFASAFLVDHQYSCLCFQTLYTFHGILCAMKVVFPDFSLTSTISKISPTF